MVYIMSSSSRWANECGKQNLFVHFSSLKSKKLTKNQMFGFVFLSLCVGRGLGRGIYTHTHTHLGNLKPSIWCAFIYKCLAAKRMFSENHMCNLWMITDLYQWFFYIFLPTLSLQYIIWIFCLNFNVANLTIWPSLKCIRIYLQTFCAPSCAHSHTTQIHWPK